MTKLEFTPCNFTDRQSAINQFIREVKLIVRSEYPRTFNHEQLVLVVLELIKNTYDHSNGVGVLSIEMPTETTGLLVSYIDTGEPFDIDYGSLPGVSSKLGNGINFGLGLPLIVYGTRGAGFDLEIKNTDNGTEFKIGRSPTPKVKYDCKF